MNAILIAFWFMFFSKDVKYTYYIMGKLYTLCTKPKYPSNQIFWLDYPIMPLGVFFIFLRHVARAWHCLLDLVWLGFGTNTSLKLNLENIGDVRETKNIEGEAANKEIMKLWSKKGFLLPILQVAGPSTITCI
ncbi:hypothetical protein ACJX0J_009298, partial [Zea mays]